MRSVLFGGETEGGDYGCTYYCGASDAVSRLQFAKTTRLRQAKAPRFHWWIGGGGGGTHGRPGMGGGTLVPDAKLSYDGCNSDDEARCRGASLDVNHA